MTQVIGGVLPRRNPVSTQVGLIGIVRHFTPNWFTATMGTGIQALALNQVPLDIPASRASFVAWMIMRVMDSCSSALVIEWDPQ